MPPRRRLDAEKRRSYDTAAVAPLASWMPATPSNVHTLTGMRLCGAEAHGVASAECGVATARRRQNRRKVVGDKPRYFELGCLDEAIGTI